MKNKEKSFHGSIAFTKEDGDRWNVPTPFALVVETRDLKARNIAYVFGDTKKEAEELAAKIADFLNNETV
jgi:hypothetical protein